MIKFSIALAASAIALAGCGEKAADTTTADAGSTTDTGVATDGMTADGQATMNGGTTTGTSGSSISAANDPAEYVRQAASSDQFEIQSSQLAVQNTKNAAVRTFAQQMITDHQASTAKLMTAVSGAALTAPTAELLPAHAELLTELRNAGDEMDKKYLEQQRKAHTDAIALHESMTNSSAAPAQLASFAREVLPRIREHSRMADAMKMDD